MNGTSSGEGLGARFTSIPDVHYGAGRHFVAGDRGASEWTLTGTTVDGEHLDVRGCDLWTLRGDQIVLKVVLEDGRAVTSESPDRAAMRVCGAA